MMSAQLATIQAEPMTNLSNEALTFDPVRFEAMQRIAQVMSEARVTVPRHLQNAPGDCLAVIMQSAQWRMNPYAVAQKTHITQSGQLGYEAQLINAVVTSIAPIRHRIEFEFIGEWSQILGKVKEQTGKSGGKYYVADWSKGDEVGLGVRAWATMKGESQPRQIEVMLSQCWPRFSTQWATDPRQQITYVAVRKWARRYAPDVLLGVYTPEELETSAERDMGTANIVTDPEPASRTESVKSKLRGKTKPAASVSLLDDVLTAISAAQDLDALKAAGEQAKPLQGDEREAALAAYKARQAALKPQPAPAEPSATDEQAAKVEASLISAASTAANDEERAEILDAARDLSPEARDRITAAFPAS
jgi:hypothetical protein